MNFFPEALPTISREKAIELLGEETCGPDELCYFAWVETFGGTTGPFGGAGGQIISQWQVEAYLGLKDALVFSQGKKIRVVEIKRFVQQYPYTISLSR